MTRTRYKVCESRSPHFLTCSVVGWLPVFSHPESVEIVLDSWRYLQQHQRLTIFGYVILENHLHLIGSAEDLAKEIGDFKSFTARRIIDWLEERHLDAILHLLEFLRAKHKTDRTYQLWQEGSHPQLIQGDEMMWQKIEYVHNNPVSRGYVEDPLHWRYSSARNYAGQAGLIPVTTDW
jgi:REP element-mobilizing transposase RayT